MVNIRSTIIRGFFTAWEYVCGILVVLNVINSSVGGGITRKNRRTITRNIYICITNITCER